MLMRFEQATPEQMHQGYDILAISNGEVSMARRSSVLCETRDCQIQITPAVLWPDGTEKIGTRVVHWSEPLWYLYVDPKKLDAHGMLVPDEMQRLATMAEWMHDAESRGS